MDEQFSSDLREFERVVARIARLKEELSFLEFERNRLRRRLSRARSAPLAGISRPDGSEQDADLLPAGQESAPNAIRRTLEAVRQLGGAARAFDVAKILKREEKVAANLLARAKKMGFLDRTDRGTYEIHKAIDKKAVLLESQESDEHLADQTIDADSMAINDASEQRDN